MKKQALFLFSAALTSSIWGFSQPRIVEVPGTDLGLPFSPGVLAGKTLYVSGNIGNKPGTMELAVGVSAQTRQTLENAAQALQAAGMSPKDVVSATIYVSDIRNGEEANRVFREFFSDHAPTRVTVEADIAIPGSETEISLIAVDPSVEKKSINPPGWQQPPVPFSWAIQAGDTLYLTQGAVDATSLTPVAGDIKTQVRKTLENVEAVLRAAGFTMQDVVSNRVFLKDARDFAAMNEVYRTFFVEKPPVRATLRGTPISPDLLVVIQSVAVKGDHQVVGTVDPSRPYSPGIQAGATLYLPGMVGRGPEGFAPGDVKAQTRQVMENLLATLKAGGMGIENVADVSVWISDIRYYQGMNEVYRSFFPGRFPARATVGSQLMSPDALVEIMMTATR